MRIVIAEQRRIGHYLSYVRLVADALLEVAGGTVVLALTPSALDSTEFKTHLEPIRDRLDIRPVLEETEGGMVRSSRQMVRNMRAAVRECRPDVLYVPTADHTAEAVGLASMAGVGPFPRGLRTECLLTAMVFTYPEATRRSVPRWVPAMALRRSPWTVIHLIDMVAYEWVRRHGGALAERVRVCPDPVPQFAPQTRVEARRALGIPEDGRMIGCHGLLIARKGINLLIEAFARAGLGRTDRVLLAGPQGPEIRELLARGEYRDLVAAGRIVSIDRYLSERELSTAISASDVICLPYPYQPHPASIAVKAAAAGRPVLGADSFWLGHMIPRFSLGWTCSVTDPDSLRDGVVGALEAAAEYQVGEAAARLVRFQSLENFRASWTAGLRERLGLPASPVTHTWDWVCDALEAPAGVGR